MLTYNNCMIFRFLPSFRILENVDIYVSSDIQSLQISPSIRKQWQDSELQL